MTAKQNPEADPGRKATEAESTTAWAEVFGILSKINSWNLPKAADHLRKRKNRPSAEAIALGIFAIDILKARQCSELGKVHGAKGGAPRKKPKTLTDEVLKKRFDALDRDTGSPREAHAELVKQIAEENKVSARTARSWLKGACISTDEAKARYIQPAKDRK